MRAASSEFHSPLHTGDLLFVCLLQGVQEIANSYVDQQQRSKERRDVIDREERRLEKRKAEKAST